MFYRSPRHLALVFAFLALGAPGFAQTINTGGVVDAASYQPLLSRGGIASLFGADLATSTQSAPTVPLPTDLAGVQVRVNDILAPLFFVSAGQINFQVPFEVPLSGTVSVVVVRGGVTSNAVDVPVGPYAPGVFINPNTGEPIVVKNADNSLVTAQNPAQPGDVLIVYVTGIGDLTNPPATGSAAVGDPLSYANVAPSVTVGGAPATVYFAGLTPNLVGLGQINIGLADASAALREGVSQGAGSASLVIDFGGVKSAPVNLPFVGGIGLSDAGVEMVEILPPQALVTDVIFVRYAVDNQGITGAAERDLYLSTDAVIDPATDTLLNTRGVTLSLGSGVYPSSLNLLPQTLTPGTYYLGIVLRAEGDINPDNDISNALPIEVVDVRAPYDISILLESVTPETVGAGDAVDIEYSATGANRLTGTYARQLWLSDDAVLDDPDILLTNRLFTISEGQTSQSSLGNIIPVDTEPGSYFLFLTVEFAGDTNQDDNISPVSLPITVVAERAPHDIGITLTDVQPRTVAPNEAIELTYLLSNPEQIDGEFVRHLYLSTDATIADTDILVNSRFTTLNGFDRNILSSDNIIPGDLTPGTYYVGVILEYSSDTNPADNVTAGIPIEVTGGGSSQFTLSNLELTAGVQSFVGFVLGGSFDFNDAAGGEMAWNGGLENSAQFEIELSGASTQNVCRFQISGPAVDCPGEYCEGTPLAGTYTVPTFPTLRQDIAKAGTGTAKLTLIDDQGNRSNMAEVQVNAEPLCAPNSEPLVFILPPSSSITEEAKPAEGTRDRGESTDTRKDLPRE